MAGFRPNSEIIGNFLKIGNFYGHFNKCHKWRLQQNFECVGVFKSRDFAIWNFETSYCMNHKRWEQKRILRIRILFRIQCNKNCFNSQIFKTRFSLECVSKNKIWTSNSKWEILIFDSNWIFLRILNCVGVRIYRI